MPKTVLAIRKQPNEQDYDVSLYYPTFAIEPYTALSYCWGGQQPYQTTKARMDAGNFSLDWNRLPRTIQDAVKVTDELGLRFLWVDSLCIPQDDEDEKQEQIACMPHIYSNATLTIVASRAQRTDEGFLQDRDLASTPDLVLVAKLPFRNSRSQSVSPASPGPRAKTDQGSIYITSWKHGMYIEQEPLDSRGWAFQERYLSLRILEYATLHTSFRCSSSKPDPFNCTDGWEVITHEYNRPLPSVSNFRNFHKRNDTTHNFDVKQEFYGIVTGFTGRQLSLHGDRILAISGIANEFQSSRGDGDEYLVGLWSRDLPGVLCWRLYELADRSPRPVPSIAPSWSWAAVEGQVGFSLLRDIEVTETLHRHPLKWRITLANQAAKYGAASHGEIEGHGAICEGLWFGQEAPATSLSVCGLDQEIRLKMRADALEKDFDHHAQLVAEGRTRGERFAEAHLQVYLLHVGYEWGGPVGLVLRRCDEMSDDDAFSCRAPKYSRLGVFSENAHDWDKRAAVKRHIDGWKTQDFILV